MPNVLVSFLGTGNYLEGIYYYGDKESGPTRFVQSAIVDIFCHDWTNEDRILIFATRSAWEKNWDSPDGCKHAIESVLNDQGPIVTPIEIPEGSSVDKIWEIFTTLAESFNENDEIYYDMTHSFRYIPMLGIIVLNYSSILKGVVIKSVLYGAFETIGTLKEVEQLPVMERKAPIFDLSSFVFLFNFVNAVNIFQKAGRADELLQVILTERNSLQQKKFRYKNIQQDEEFLLDALNQLKPAIENIYGFTRAVRMCRGRDIRGFNYSFKLGNKNMVGPVKALAPLLDKIGAQVSEFEENNAYNMILAAKWCINYGLIQQAYTFLDEGVISVLLERVIGPEKIIDRDLRVALSSLLSPNRDKPGFETEVDDAMLRPIVKTMSKEFFDAFSMILQYRNDINHAGEKSKVESSDILERKLQEIVTVIEDNLSDYAIDKEE